MAKTLVIKSADFSVNKLDTVVFADIPCTSITIEATKTISGIGTATIVPVVTPANTTDTIIWTSSNPSIATVANGVVTALNYGSSIITATCGNFSASCEVTVSMSLTYAKNATIFPEIAVGLIDAILGKYVTNNSFISVGATENEYPVVCGFNTGEIAAIYPIKIPNGAQSITITMPNFACVFEWMVDNVKSTADIQDRVRDSAKLLDGETPSGGTDWSIPSWTFNTRTVTIPEGVNSFAITLYTTNATAFENFSLDDISFSFSFGNE